MTVHCLMLYEEGKFKELSKEFDLSIHNSMRDPQTDHFVEDNFITFFYPEELDRNKVFETYASSHDVNVIETWELSVVEKEEDAQIEVPDPTSLDDGRKAAFMEGYKMSRIHYWTKRPTKWELNPDADTFVFNHVDLQQMILFN